ncbi:DUF1684 domain-containing protein [Lysobacter sp. A421]
MPKLHHMFVLLCLTTLGVALGGCERSNLSPTNDEVSMSAEEFAFKQSQQAWRQQRRAGLVAADGWTSLVGLHWIEPGAHYLGSDADNGMRLAMGPEHIGMIELRDDRVRLVPEAGVALTVDGEPLTGEAWLRADDDPAGPTTLGFDGGDGRAVVIKRNDRLALRVRHAQAPTRTGFAGLEYWPADPEWVLPARFVPHPAGQTMEIANIIGAFDEVANPGLVEFERDGVSYQLEAIDEGGDTLFLVFADRTNGHGSYGAGRFVYVPKPDADGRLVVDFNQAYNPPCAFTAFATCPLPPLENRLDLAVTAGEKSYVAGDAP